MKIVFGFKSDQVGSSSDWDYAESHPLGGAETAVLRMASAFRDLGHDVEVVNYPSTSAELRALMAGKACDIFVNSRLPSVILALQRPPGRLNYYWAHDDVDQPLLAPLHKPDLRDAFFQRVNGLFLLSHYQRARFSACFGLPLEKTHLLTNPIAHERFRPNASELRQRGAVAYYASTPYRGLEALLDAWPNIRRVVPQAEVHVFSSLAVNGLAETEKSEALYRRARETEGVVYRGAVSQKVVRETALCARVLAYPCSFPETSCIAAMEAMAAGAVVVGTELGALPETAWKNPLIALGDGWLARWRTEVTRVLADDDYYEDLARQNLAIAASYDASVVARRMSHVFRRDLASIGVRVDARLRALP